MLNRKVFGLIAQCFPGYPSGSETIFAVFVIENILQDISLRLVIPGWYQYKYVAIP